MLSSKRALMILLALTLTLANFGCQSNDKHVFRSTIHRPTTITLLDVYQNESVWEMDIPVNYNLVLDFENNVDQATVSDMGTAPSWVDWQLYRADDQPADTGRSRKGVLVNSDRVDLTGTRVRVIVNYRPAPEMPGSVEAAPIPVMETPESVAAEAAAEAKAQSMAAQEKPEAAEKTEEATESAQVKEAEEAAEMADEAADQAKEAEDATK